MQASVDQSTLDIMLAFFFGSALAMYFNLLGAIVVMTQTAWPIIVILLPLSYVYFSYQVILIISVLLLLDDDNEDWQLLTCPGKLVDGC